MFSQFILNESYISSIRDEFTLFEWQLLDIIYIFPKSLPEELQHMYNINNSRHFIPRCGC